ncbi:MAG TPA: helix-turn-helix domain-containing protein [Clostridiales bacterium]|nr:helix-turn-helix domain-containing protein [Clostridiales bacterium]
MTIEKWFEGLSEKEKSSIVDGAEARTGYLRPGETAEEWKVRKKENFDNIVKEKYQRYLRDVEELKKIREQTRMTQKAFADYFNIPVRTLQDWEAKKRTPPPYVVELIKYKIEKERLGMLRLIEKNEGKETVLAEGTLKEVVNYLKENSDLLDWMNYSPWIDDGSPETELPDLDEVKTLRDLRYELSKINLSWWSLEVEEIGGVEE